MAKRVIISHKDGRQYSVELKDFRKLYEPEGFRVESYEDGTPYEPPAPKASNQEPEDEP